MERKLALVAEGGMTAFVEPQLMVDGVEITAKALAYGCTWQDAWVWVRDALNLMA